MSKFTPTTEDVRDVFVWLLAGDNSALREETGEDFDRWLAQVQAEAKSRALEDAAEDWEDTTWQDTWLADDVHDDVSAVQSTVRWLRERAARTRAGEHR